MPICLPTGCLFCELNGLYPLANICPACFDALPRLEHCCLQCALPVPIPQKVCGKCLNKPPPCREVVASCPYSGAIASLILRIKDSGNTDCLEILGRLLEERLAKTGSPKPDCLIPVPMHPWKRLRRGFNQTDLLARYLHKSMGVRLGHDILGRRLTRDQRDLDLRLRASNVKRAFYPKEGVEGLRVVLLDDVMTTGATLHSAARALLGAGALRVDAWVVARTLAD